MRNTLVLSVRGSFGPEAPGEPVPQPPPQPTTADADAGPLAASHMPDTEAEAVMPSAPNLNTVPPPAADDPRRRGPSAEAGGDAMVGDEMDGDSMVVRRTDYATAATTSTGGAMASYRRTTGLYFVFCFLCPPRETCAKTSTAKTHTNTGTRERRRPTD